MKEVMVKVSDCRDCPFCASKDEAGCACARYDIVHTVWSCKTCEVEECKRNRRGEYPGMLNPGCKLLPISDKCKLPFVCTVVIHEESP